MQTTGCTWTQRKRLRDVAPLDHHYDKDTRQSLARLPIKCFRDPNVKRIEILENF